ncbi:hypothetical protein G7Z17_g358 [Cylindrodendrum hubeiense]|uniref:Major facilitator superfamily (MFS) profile domain-containing protein n=1 Tax=Cylindrodendrum hubeiense TaxID=595255 RepID=A0A9P5LDF8_9HYPO|nr:hypothetical protein G7Z17_g358 [Cylindrodendrum hubeiense]
MATTTTTQLEPGRVSETYELASGPYSSPRDGEEPPVPQINSTDSKIDRATYLKITSAAFSFFVAGVNDGSFGALVPYVIRDYGINTAIVSSVLGQAYQDTHGNTFVAGTKGAHRWLAVIHAMYMAGCLCGPFVATAIASSGDKSHWYLFYCFPLAIGLFNVALVFTAFRDTVGFKRKQSPNNSATAMDTETAVEAEHSSTANISKDEDAFTLIKDTLRTRSVWLLSLFFFCFLGATLTASGWVVEYLVVVRDGDLSQMGYIPAGFNGGALLGRLLLAEPTHRFGARMMIFIFSVLSIGLQVLFWLIPNIIAASISISLLGFFMGPFFATGISVGSKLFSPRLQSTALAFVFVFAQLGGCFFPIVTGLIAARAGVAAVGHKIVEATPRLEEDIR